MTPRERLSILVNRYGTRETGARIGLTQRSVQRILKGEQNPRPVKATKITNVYRGVMGRETAEARRNRQAFRYRPGQEPTDRRRARPPRFYSNGQVYVNVSKTPRSDQYWLLLGLKSENRTARIVYEEELYDEPEKPGRASTGWMRLSSYTDRQIRDLADERNLQIIYQGRA